MPTAPSGYGAAVQKTSVVHAITVFDAGRPLTSVAFSPTGNRLAVAGVDGQIVVWDLPSGQRHLFENNDRAIVYDVAFDPKHDRLTSVSASGHLRMWRLQDGDQLWERNAAEQLPDDIRAKEELAGDLPGSLISVAYSPDGQRVAAGGVNWTKAGGAVGFLQRFNADDGATVGEPIKVGNAVMGIAFSRTSASASGDRIVVASFDPYEVQLWDTDKPNDAQFIFAGHQAQVVSVAISPDNRRIFSASADGSLRIWPNLPTTPADEAICAKLTSSMTEKQWDAWISTEMPPQETCPKSVGKRCGQAELGVVQIDHRDHRAAARHKPQRRRAHQVIPLSSRRARHPHLLRRRKRRGALRIRASHLLDERARRHRSTTGARIERGDDGRIHLRTLRRTRRQPGYLTHGRRGGIGDLDDGNLPGHHHERKRNQLDEQCADQ